MDGKLLALREIVFTYRIPESYFTDLLRGVEMDLTKNRYRTFLELKEYCYCVASVVGLMMTKVMGVSDDSALQNAEDLGTAMQLTNILRDIREDAAMGRIYLPQEELDRFGYSEQMLKNGVMNEEFRELMRFQVQRAREYYGKGELGIPFITNDGSRFCAALMGRTYGAILDRIEDRDFDVYSSRVFVPTRQKVMIALGSLLGIRSGVKASREDIVSGSARSELVKTTVQTLPAIGMQ
jgi:phytoene synthase